MEYVPLADGTKMPVLGFGTMRVKNLPGLIPEVIEAGYRLIDTAANYDNEREVGEGIRRAMAEGLVRREDLFVTSKMQILADGARNTERAVESSLENLGLDHLDPEVVRLLSTAVANPIEVGDRRPSHDEWAARRGLDSMTW